MSEKPFVKNSGDKEQVKQAAQRERSRRERELNDIRELLDTAEGKRFLWRLLEYCRTFESIWDASARIHYRSGQQDVGHFLMAEIVAADADALIVMMKAQTKED